MVNQKQEAMTSRSRYLDDNLIEDILIRVDTKTLHRSICVCKTWESLISNAAFKNRFIKRSKSLRPPLVNGFFFVSEEVSFCDSGIGGNSVDTSLSFLRRNVIVVASDKGLVLCVEYPLDYVLPYLQYIVCNPLTKQWLDLPRHVRNLNLSSYDAVLVCYENRESIAPRLEFEVVLFINQKLQKVEIYSSETRKWTVSKTSYRNSDVCLDSKIMLNGKVYFLANTQLVVYDLKDQSIRSFKLPLTTTSLTNLLGVSAGSLYYSSSDNDSDCRVWILVGEREWSFELDIDLVILRSEFPKFSQAAFRYIYHLGFHPLDPNIVVLGSDLLVFFYNTVTREIKDIRNLDRMYLQPVIPYCLLDCLPCLTKTLFFAK